MQKFLLDRHASPHFLSLEILAASVRGEGLGCEAHQTSSGKTPFPIAN